MILNGSNEFTKIELNDIGYVFSPNIVQISAPMTEINKVEISIADKEGKSYRETWVFNNVADVKRDISQLLRAFFELDKIDPWKTGISETCKKIRLFFYVTTNDGEDVYESLNDYTIIFGAVKPFRYYFSTDSEFKIKQYYNLPFSLDFPLMENGRVKTNLNNHKMIYDNKETGNTNVSLFIDNPIIINVGTLLPGSTYKVYVDDYAFMTNTYDSYPFIEANISRFTYSILFEDKKDGVYLMWINSMGGKSYFLFQKKGEILRVDKDEYNKPEEVSFSFMDSIPQWNKKATRVLTLALPLADKEEYGYVEEVLYSPMVYMLSGMGDSFIRVNVQTGDFERTSAELQDFVFKIELPEELTIKI